MFLIQKVNHTIEVGLITVAHILLGFHHQRVFFDKGLACTRRVDLEALLQFESTWDQGHELPNHKKT